MSEFNKYSTDGGATFIDVEDSKAVHWGDQSKGYVGKNLLKNNASTTTISGVSFTVNSDGSITLNGTATANITSFFINSNMALKAGSYWLTGNPSGITGTSYGLRIANTSYSVNTFFEQGKILTLNQDYSDLRIDIRIPSGQVIDNLTFYPMIRLASISDSTYEPYLTPNTEIDNKLSCADNTILGAKNLFGYTPKTFSQNGATFVVNEDGSVTVDTNGSDTTGNAIFIYGYYVPPKGDYIISKQSTEDTLLSNVLLQFNERMGGTYKRQTNLRNDKAKPVSITYSDYDNFQLCVVVESGQTVNNKTIYPMLRLSSDTDDTYAPHAMTNRELTEMTEVVSHTITPHSDITLTAYDCWTSGNVGYMSVNMTTNASISGETNVLTLDKNLFNRTHSCSVYIRNERLDQIDTFFDFDGKNVRTKQSITSGKIIRFTTMFML